MCIRRGSRAEHDLFWIGRNGEQLEPSIIEPEIELAFAREAQVFVVSVPCQRDRNLVLGVHWEQMADDRTATRADGRAFVQTIVLNQAMRNVIGLIRHGYRAIADRGSADLARGRKVPFQQYG